MTWRRFAALLAGLSLQSRWAASLHADRNPSGVRRITNPVAAERYFAGIT